VHADVGDHIVVENSVLDATPRRGTVVAVLGKDEGLEHYQVRWQDGHESLFFPGPDAHLEKG
jgi:hypothetical protein